MKCRVISHEVKGRYRMGLGEDSLPAQEFGAQILLMPY